MLLEVESAKSAAYYAGWAAAEDSDELPVVASLAKSYCSEAYFHAAAETIQIHGGHRLHLGAPRPPVLQAGQVLGADARRPVLPPRAVGPAHRHLSARACRLPRAGSAPAVAPLHRDPDLALDWRSVSAMIDRDS